MSRTTNGILITLLLSPFLSMMAHGATRVAASCSQSDVQAAINSAAGGDTVTIPACSQTNWSSTLTITKGITLQGAGEAQTIIGDNVSKGGSSCTGGGPLVAWSVNAPATFRMTGLTIVGVATDTAVCQRGHIRVNGSTHSMRIDHITINPVRTVGIYIDGDIWGLIDHLTHVGDYKNGVRVEHTNWNGTSNDSWGDRSWAAAINYGSGEGIYIEDSSFTSTATSIGGVVDCFSGGRMVFRHNTVSMLNVQSHGADSDQRHRACRWMEIYSNNFSYSNVNNLAFIAWIRGGTGVFHNNVISAPGYSNKIVQVVNCRDASAGCGGGPSYTPWGACNGTSPYDQNTSGGYRCVDQPGSGSSSLLGPDTSGGITPSNTPVRNILDPIYVWGNTLNGSSNNVASGSTNVTVNRDYYVGTARPNYTPYTYPHPLSTAQTTPPADTTPPSVPTSLSTTSTSSSQINISWNASADNVGVAGYRLERCQGSSCTNFAQIATPSGTSYSDSGLSASTTYQYRGRAADAAGNLSTYSNLASATTKALTSDAPPPLPSGNTGIASRYPNDTNIASDSSVVFFDDFESYTSSGQLTNRWNNFYQSGNTRIASEAGNFYSGTKGLEFTLPATSVEVSNAVVKNISPTRDQLFIRAYTKFDPGYQITTGSNHNGLRISAQYPGPGTPPTGSDFFMAMMENAKFYSEADPGYAHIYLYHPEQRSQWGDVWYPDGKVLPFDQQFYDFGPYFVSRANFIPQRDKWYCYELMVKANTPGQRDGRIAFWIDGNLMADFQNVRLRDISTLKIDQIQLELHAQAGGSSRPNKKWYDNVVVATSYIGPKFTGTTVVNPPTGFTATVN